MNTNNVNNSTGPRTDAGKQTSARNAIKHGCCSNETLIIANAGETIEQFEALEAAWLEAYIFPEDDVEAHLLHQTIQADWFLQRANRTLAQVEADIYNLNPMPINWNDRDHHAIQRFTRYQTARRNEFTKAKKALDDHRKIQAAEQRSEQKQEILKAKFQIYKEKNKPKSTLEDQFAELQQVAAKLGIKSTAPNLK